MSDSGIVPRSPEQLVLLPTAVVALRSNGAQLVSRDQLKARPIDLSGLVLLHQLASVSPGGGVDAATLIEDVGDRTGTSTAVVEDLLDDLRARGLCVVNDGVAYRPLGARLLAPRLEVAHPGEDEVCSLVIPVVLRPTERGFVALDWQGNLLVELEPAAVLAATAFRHPTTLAAARESVEVIASGLAPSEFDGLVDHLLAADLLRKSDGSSTAHSERSGDAMRSAIVRKMKLRKAVDDDLARRDADEAERRSRTGQRRIPVMPIHHQGGYVPLGLGMILSHVQSRTGTALEQHFWVRPDWVAADRGVEHLPAEPGVYLFSNYLWSHRPNLELCQQIKAANPANLTIHGGPDTPQYEDDLVAYLDTHPHVDIAVHGEGEMTIVDILEALSGRWQENGEIDLSPLLDVPGLSFRHEGRVVRTGSRERLADLNVIPSPFLSGLFDAYRGVPGLSIVLETNRGCPYGCTFCDWGTATMARIRKFDLDRVMAEFEWCATAQAQGVALADANFGIFERDVEIAAKVVELKREHGYPMACTGSYAKNTVKHLEKIIGMWVDAEMLTLGVLSLQSMDPATLKAVHRSNIKTDKYDQIARQFRRRNLPLYVDLMMGLPGATLDSFVDDLQSCIEREVQAKIHDTVLLPNSPMNEPGYRVEHGIQVRSPAPPGSADRDTVVVSTATMSETDLAFMHRLVPLYLFSENFGVLRHLARYLRHETGQREVELYLRLVACADEAPERWPAIDFLVRSMDHIMAPPVSWKLLLEEVRDLMIEQFGVADDSALDTVLQVQLALLPAAGHPERVTLELQHDYTRWHDQMIEAKLDATDWTSATPSLRTLPPATLEIDDPLRLSERMMGFDLGKAWFDSWELVSPVARPSVFGTGQPTGGEGETALAAPA